MCQGIACKYELIAVLPGSALLQQKYLLILLVLYFIAPLCSMYSVSLLYICESYKVLLLKNTVHLSVKSINGNRQSIHGNIKSFRGNMNSIHRNMKYIS